MKRRAYRRTLSNQFDVTKVVEKKRRLEPWKSGQRTVACEPALVLVLDHRSDKFGAISAQASDSVIDAFDHEHNTPKAHRIRRCDRGFDLDKFWIVKLRQLSCWRSSPFMRDGIPRTPTSAYTGSCATSLWAEYRSQLTHSRLVQS